MKICFIILTCEAYLSTRTHWQNLTCLKNIDPKDVYFISCKKSGENVYGWDTADNYESCPTKYIKFFRNMNIDYDWYIFIDDDTYINTKNLGKFLENYDPTEPYYIGSDRNITKHFDRWKIPFMSGGAGFCLSKYLYSEVTRYVRSNNDENLFFCVNGDVTVGSWILKLQNVIYIDDPRFCATKHESEDQLKDFISFHYLKSKADFEFYYSVESK